MKPISPKGEDMTKDQILKKFEEIFFYEDVAERNTPFGGNHLYDEIKFFISSILDKQLVELDEGGVESIINKYSSSVLNGEAAKVIVSKFGRPKIKWPEEATHFVY